MARRPLGTSAVVAHEAIVRLCSSDLPQLDLLEQIAARVRSVVPYDASSWLLTDPATLLYTGALSEDTPPEVCLAFMDNELTADDYAKFSQVARHPRSVVTLSEATGGDPARSPRHRRLNSPLGWREELRAAFRTGETCWGVANLTRAEGDFSDAEVDFVRGISEHVAHGLRTGLLLDACQDGGAMIESPGMVILSDDDSLESLSGEARRWLGELPAVDGLELPMVVYAVARRARACSEGGPPARARVRLPSGRWLLVHGAQLSNTRGGEQRTGVLLEPARRADLAPLVAELYELSERERQVTRLLVSGMPVDEIAQSLWISPHTVRDHTKAVFAKLGVHSRPELTAMLFHEHFLPEFQAQTRIVPGRS